MQHSFLKRLWHQFIRGFSRLIMVFVFRVRVFGQSNVPKSGGVMMVSNHQSHLDPILVGCACHRHLNYLARLTLFKFKPFAWLINSMDAIPLDRDGVGLAGLKEMMRRLKKGKIVLIFPEGTRSEDGKLADLKPGFIAIARKTKVPLAPVAIAGAYEAWPRRNKFPTPRKICLQFGEPISPKDYSGMDDQQLLAEVRLRLQQCLSELNQKE